MCTLVASGHALSYSECICVYECACVCAGLCVRLHEVFVWDYLYPLCVSLCIHR